MTVIVQTPFNQHVANGVTTVFGFTFQLLDAGDLQVTVGGVLVGGYSISGLGVQAGGSITFVSPPANLAVVDIRRVIPLARSIDYQQNGDLPSSLIDMDFDRIWQAFQDAEFVSSQALTLPLADPSVPMVLPAAGDRANRFMAFDANGDVIAALSTPPGVPVSAFMETLLDDASEAAARATLIAAKSGANSDITSLAGLTTALSIAQGGTGQTTAPQAFSALKQAATDTATGVIEIATGAEALAGTDNVRAVTPAGLRSGLSASGSAPVYAARAWVNFAGTTGAIRASGNVSSVTRNGVGDYLVNLSTAMADANYSVTMGGRQTTPNYSAIQEDAQTARTASAVRISSLSQNSGIPTPFDSDVVSLAFFR